MENKSDKLIVKIENNKLKISELFDALQNIEEGIKKQTLGESEIFIQEVRKGSMIFELIQVVAVGAIPFVENINSLSLFIENLNKCKKFLTFNKQEDTSNVDIDEVDIKNLGGIANIVSSPNSTINIYINNYPDNSNFSLDYDEAYSIKKNIPLYISNNQKNLEYKNSEIMPNALIYFVQTNIKSEKADRAICEKVSKQPIKIIFNNDEIKKEILENPYNYNFVVDMEVQYRENKPTLYTILKLKEKWENKNLGL